jgi:hypothetical protein
MNFIPALWIWLWKSFRHKVQYIQFETVLAPNKGVYLL